MNPSETAAAVIRISRNPVSMPPFTGVEEAVYFGHLHLSLGKRLVRMEGQTLLHDVRKGSRKVNSIRPNNSPFTSPPSNPSKTGKRLLAPGRVAASIPCSAWRSTMAIERLSEVTAPDLSPKRL
ncbi:hypothetical protein CDD80_1258 [Ophiocordyceps camponoti-rufipedis]|uniref:Uncharacterized protein n=1 Tax=Ophiocordyceps camponoti-rufipedis TaxID=2004952 RepID=A0A2C5ZMG6_9HYPO|nr:hypothetical protein CDD80_1258 [Ophiocordyceps camponoti-rufipedis]